MRFKPRHYWMLFPVMLLLMSVAIQGTAAYVASKGNDAEVEQDYYQRAVDWGGRQELLAQSRALGWTVKVLPGALDIDDISDLNLAEARAVISSAPINVVVQVEDADGLAVDGAVASLEAFHVAHADHVVRQEMDSVSPGVFQTTILPLRAGKWNWRLTLERGETTFLYETQVPIRRIGEPAATPATEHGE